MRHVLEKPARLELRVDRSLRDVEDRCRRHTRLSQDFQRGLILLKGLQPVLYVFADLVAVLETRGRRGITRIGLQLRFPHRFDQCWPLVPSYGKDDVALFRCVHAIWTHVKEVAAKTMRPDRALAHEKEGEVNVVEIDEGFE